MKVPVVGWTIDERFLMHRLRSTSVSGMAGGLLAAGLFIYHLYADRVARWELFAIIATMAVVKMSMLLWYRFHD